MSNKFIVALDMDGLLTDWFTDALKLVNKKRTDGDVVTALNSGSLKKMDALFGGIDELRRLIKEAGEDFWMNLKPHDWALELLDVVNHSPHDVVICTSSGSWPESASYKIKYLKEKFDLDNFCICSQKHLLAGNGNLLIDDFQDNINKFAANGGKTFLWPEVDLLANRTDLSHTFKALEKLLYLK